MSDESCGHPVYTLARLLLRRYSRHTGSSDISNLVSEQDSVNSGAETRERDRVGSSRVGCCRLLVCPLPALRRKPIVPLYRPERQLPRVPAPSRSRCVVPARLPAPLLATIALRAALSATVSFPFLLAAPCLTFSPLHSRRLDCFVPSRSLRLPPSCSSRGRSRGMPRLVAKFSHRSLSLSLVIHLLLACLQLLAGSIARSFRGRTTFSSFFLS